MDQWCLTTCPSEHPILVYWIIRKCSDINIFLFLSQTIGCGHRCLVRVGRCPSILDLHAYGSVDIRQNRRLINCDNNIMFAQSLYLLILIQWSDMVPREKIGGVA